jgi:hypothetical protein
LSGLCSRMTTELVFASPAPESRERRSPASFLPRRCCERWCSTRSRPLTPVLANVGMSAIWAACSASRIPLRRASPISLRTAESRTFTSRGESFHPRPPLHQQRPGERPAGTEGEQVVERLGIVVPGRLGNWLTREQAKETADGKARLCDLGPAVRLRSTPAGAGQPGR